MVLAPITRARPTMLIANDNGIHYFKTNEPADHRARIGGGLMTGANHRTNGLRMRESALENMSSEVMHNLSFSPFIFRSARTSYRTFDSRPVPSVRAKNPDHLYSLINHRRTTVNLSNHFVKADDTGHHLTN